MKTMAEKLGWTKAKGMQPNLVRVSHAIRRLRNNGQLW